jgi:hypothetical protein
VRLDPDERSVLAARPVYDRLRLLVLNYLDVKVEDLVPIGWMHEFVARAADQFVRGEAEQAGASRGDVAVGPRRRMAGNHVGGVIGEQAVSGFAVAEMPFGFVPGVFGLFPCGDVLGGADELDDAAVFIALKDGVPSQKPAVLSVGGAKPKLRFQDLAVLRRVPPGEKLGQSLKIIRMHERRQRLQPQGENLLSGEAKRLRDVPVGVDEAMLADVEDVDDFRRCPRHCFNEVLPFPKRLFHLGDWPQVFDRSGPALDGAAMVAKRGGAHAHHEPFAVLVHEAQHEFAGLGVLAVHHSLELLVNRWRVIGGPVGIRRPRSEQLALAHANQSAKRRVDEELLALCVRRGQSARHRLDHGSQENFVPRIGGKIRHEGSVPGSDVVDRRDWGQTDQLTGILFCLCHCRPIRHLIFVEEAVAADKQFSPRSQGKTKAFFCCQSPERLREKMPAACGISLLICNQVSVTFHIENCYISFDRQKSSRSKPDDCGRTHSSFRS